MPRSSKWSLSLRFPHQNPVYTSLLKHATPPFIIDSPSTMIFGEEYKSRSVSSFDFHATVISRRLGPSVFLSALSSNVLSPCSSLSVNDQVSEPAPFNPLNPELNPICYLLALLGAHHFFHVSRIRVKILTFRRLTSYIYIYIYIYMEHPFLMFLDHTQRRSTVGRTPLDE